MALAQTTPLARTETARPLDRWWRRGAPYVFISPFYLVFLAFGLLPIVYSLGVSLYDWRGVTPGSFVGLANYRVLLHDPAFFKALRNTVFVWIGSVPPMIFLALLFAVLLNSRRVRLRGFFRTVYFLPVVTSLVITGLIFSFLLSPTFGVANRLLDPLGIGPIDWLSDPHWMKVALVLALLWRWTGNDMVIMLAGLQSIPGDLYEAARVDGADRGQTFRHITVPQLAPITLFVFVTQCVGALQMWEAPLVLTFGGPDNSTRTMVYSLYSDAFGNLTMGLATAQSVILLVILMALSAFNLRVFRVKY